MKINERHLPTCKCPPCLDALRRQQKLLREVLGPFPMMDEAIASAELAGAGKKE